MASQDNYHIFQWHFIQLNSSIFHSHTQALFLLLSFFSILILVTTLFLCVHLCRRRFSPPLAATVVTSTMPAHQWVVVDYTTTHHSMMLPAMSITKSSLGLFENKECCICLSHFQDNEKLKVLTECQHAYHSECVDLWLSAHPSCPLCRASLSLQVSNSLKKSMASL